MDREQTAQIASRLDAAVQGADVLVVQGGVNDLVHGEGLATAVPNLRAMVARGTELGLRVALVELVPNDNFPQLDEPIRELNEAIRALGRDADPCPCSSSTRRSRIRSGPVASVPAGRTTGTTRPSRGTGGSASWRSARSRPWPACPPRRVPRPR